MDGMAKDAHGIAGCGRNTQMLELGYRTTRFAPLGSSVEADELPARSAAMAKETNHE